jgi:probable blue pigment (indigoidine) exporter
MNKIIAGLVFALLWGSGSVTIKLGIKEVQPMLLNNIRFVVAAMLILLFVLFIKKERLPQGKEWRNLFFCGLLSMAIYPTVFIFAMKEVTPGIGTLASATCPLIISVLNAVFLSQKITKNIWLGLILGLLGIVIAVFPLLKIAHATPFGVGLMASSMLCYSVATVYYQSIDWSLSKWSINGWQILFGALLMLPFTLFSYESEANHFTPQFYFSLFWLAIPISIFASQIWLYLLKVEPLRASFWLYLCPIVGFFLSALITHEPITGYTIVGTVLVLVGLYIGKKV